MNGFIDLLGVVEWMVSGTTIGIVCSQVPSLHPSHYLLRVDFKLITFFAFTGQASTGVETCYNDKGDVVKHGEQFIPHGIHMCTHVSFWAYQPDK